MTSRQAESKTLGTTLAFGVRGYPRHFIQALKRSEFIVGWQLQARLSTPTLAILLAVLPFQLGLVVLPSIALSWGLLAASYYEIRRRRGVDCLYRRVSREQSHTTLRWLVYQVWFILKLVVVLGLMNYLTTKVVCFVRRRWDPAGEMRTFGQKMIFVFGIGKSGVVAARHFLEQAGYSLRKIYLYNLLGRVFELPFKMVDAILLYGFYRAVAVIDVYGLALDLGYHLVKIVPAL